MGFFNNFEFKYWCKRGLKYHNRKSVDKTTKDSRERWALTNSAYKKIKNAERPKIKSLKKERKQIFESGKKAKPFSKFISSAIFLPHPSLLSSWFPLLELSLQSSRNSIIFRHSNHAVCGLLGTNWWIQCGGRTFSFLSVSLLLW